jgi:hypothetical protein
MCQAQTEHDANEERQKALEVMYQQVAAQHDKIDDFRGKLLAVLPAITGLALFFGGRLPASPDHYLLEAIGIFGALASVGLFVHELRGISECYMLIGIGASLERKLTKAEGDDARYGPFSTRYSRGFNGPVSRESAAIIVYPATIAAWIFIAISQPVMNLWHLIAACVAPVTVFILIALVSEKWLVSNSHKVTDDVRGASGLVNTK